MPCAHAAENPFEPPYTWITSANANSVSANSDSLHSQFLIVKRAFWLNLYTVYLPCSCTYELMQTTVARVYALVWLSYAQASAHVCHTMSCKLLFNSSYSQKSSSQSLAK